ncbi:MAG: hypothetical protein H5T41_01110 [Methanomassiliicoccales archaeon]|nr:hypothetical protein [Methanomassiliicoccales archaeon]
MTWGISQFRQQISYLIYSLNKRHCISLLISDETTLARFREVVSYSVDGVIRLFRRDNPYTDQRERALEIIKMKRIPVPIDYVTFEIGKKVSEFWNDASQECAVYMIFLQSHSFFVSSTAFFSRLASEVNCSDSSCDFSVVLFSSPFLLSFCPFSFSFNPPDRYSFRYERYSPA